MNPLFPTAQKSEDLISICSLGILDFNPQPAAQDVIVEQRFVGETPQS
jgi:hypothetical protein